MNLNHVTDSTLHFDTLELVKSEREHTVKILHHIKEIDRRKLFSDHECSSLFDYCVRKLGYSESSAHRRIQAARLLEIIPEVEEKIETGLLSLSNVATVMGFFKKEEIRNEKEKKEVLQKIEGLSKDACEQKLLELSHREFHLKDTKKRIGKDFIRLNLTVSDKTMQKLKRLQDFLGIMSMDELISLIAEESINIHKKKQFKLTERPQITAAIKKENGRTPSAYLKRKIYARDKKCQKCGSTHRLQFDHIKPWALGGGTTLENMRLLCFHCNQREGIRAGLIKNIRSYSGAM